MNPIMREGYQLLFDNANPIIKNEVASALGTQDGELRAEMLACPEVRYWINCLRQFVEKRQVHNADDHCLENAMHKLISFGIRESDDICIRETNDYILEYVYSNKGNLRFFDSINNVIAASWLSCMGREEDIIAQIIYERINAVYPTAKEKNYDIYVSPQGYPAIPASRKMHPLVNPVFYENNVWRLPSVHDVFAYSHLPKELSARQDIIEKIEAITEYIMDERYQRLDRGYGLMLFPPNTYYSMGWSAHLPGYFDDSAWGVEGVVWSMEWMSRLKTARQSSWFKKMLQHLNSYSNNGIYEFPKEYLTESRGKYYVGGGHMGLGEDRRKKSWRRIESTIWMLRILDESNVYG